jgi:hypothetical protein
VTTTRIPTRCVPALDGIGVTIGGVVADRSLVREGTFLGWLPLL